MKIIDGRGAVLGRLASFAAKEALKGEDVVVVNCNEIIISGNKKTTGKEFFEKRSRHGHSQKGPIHSRTSERMVKRTIRGMLPNHREGKGRIAFKKIICYNKTPEEYAEKKKIEMKSQKLKFSKIGDFER